PPRERKYGCETPRRGRDGEGSQSCPHRRYVDPSSVFHVRSPFKDRRHEAGGRPVLLRNARVNAEGLWNPAANPTSSVPTARSRSRASAFSARKSARARIGVRPSAARKRRAKCDGLTATAAAMSFA